MCCRVSKGALVMLKCDSEGYSLMPSSEAELTRHFAEIPVRPSVRRSWTKYWGSFIPAPFCRWDCEPNGPYRVTETDSFWDTSLIETNGLPPCPPSGIASRALGTARHSLLIQVFGVMHKILYLHTPLLRKLINNQGTPLGSRLALITDLSSEERQEQERPDYVLDLFSAVG
eukprot:scaffold2707_cov90-Skeletonema_dohrnii-CCMP3373.AAC.3